jgi:DNA-binding response OmpR family regulator
MVKEEMAMAKKILVIEDDPATSRLVDYSLRHEGYQVFTASNGLDGIRKALEEIPDLIILDVMLPGMDGFEICHRLRSETKTAEVPVLMFSAKSQDIDKTTGLLVGADAYLTKPAPPSSIVENVQKLIDTKHKPASDKEKKVGKR